MAHELDTNEATGKAAMFSRRETPWHAEGELLTEAPSFNDGLRLAGHDFEVVKVPVEVVMPSGERVPSRYSFATIRTDRARELGTVGPDYTVLQNHEAFAVLEPLLDAGVAHLETGGTLREGRDVWMLVRFTVDNPRVVEVFGSDVVPFGLITNNHAGQRGVVLSLTPIRVVCANTLGLALSRTEKGYDKTVKVCHTANVRERLVVEAETLFTGYVQGCAKLAELYAAMKACILTDAEFERLVLDPAAPLPPKAFTPDGQHLTSRGYEAAYDAAEARRAAIFQKWEQGEGHTGNRSAWEAYNGAVEVIDHDAEMFRTRGSRVASLLGGRLSERKAGVLRALTAHVG